MDAIRLLLANSATAKIRNAFASKTAHHAYIIEGESTTVATALRLFSAFAVCKQGGCMLCNDCSTAIKGLHLDVKSYPVGEKGKMTVDDARSIVNENTFRARTGENKVILIDACVCSYDMSWQRILLKTLEEPNKNTYLFIGTTNAGELLDTVRSRCYTVSLDKMPTVQIAEYFANNGFDAKNSQIAAVMCEGNIVRAESILHDGELLNVAEVIIDMFINMKNSAMALPYIDRLTNFEKKYRQIFCFMQILLRETLVEDNLKLLTLFKQDVEKIASIYSPDAVLHIIPIIDEASRLVADGTYYTSVLDKLIMKILEVKYRCRLS